MERVVPSRWPALLVLCAGSLMIILDGTVVAVALPAIQRDLGFSAPGLAWVVNAYLVAFGGLLLLAGRLGDLLGAHVDAELEPFRRAGEGTAVTWLHQVG